MAYEIQRSFAAGELTPTAWLRSDLGKLYESALKKMRNVIADPHGVAESRLGFDFIEELVDEVYCRLFDYDFSASEAAVVAITPNFISIIDKSGFSLGNNSIVNGHFSAGGASWFEQNTLFSSGLAILQPGNNPNQDALIRQEITGLTIGQPYRIEVNGFGPNGANPFDLFLGSAAGQADYLNVTGAVREFTIDFTPTATSLWFEVNIGNGGLTKTIDVVSMRLISTLGPIKFVSPYTDNDIFEMQVEKEPGNRRMYMFTRGQTPRVLSYDGINYSFDEVVFSFGTGSSPWGTENPGCVAFHNGRMAIGGTYSEPVTVWLSKPQNYTNFDVGDGSTDDLAMELPLDKPGELQWLRSNKELFAGLDTGEHVIFGTAGPIAPSNAQTQQHSAYGSSRAHAIIVDERIVFIDTQRRTVRAMDYSDGSKGYRSESISFQAEHITLGRVTDLKYGISPHGVVWFPTFNGDLVGCSIERDQGTLGWHRHDTQGRIISMTTLKEFGVDIPWIAVERNGKLFIERYSVDDLAYMDSAHQVVLAAPGTVFLGFDHLIGLTVQVVADGSVHPDVVVQPDGSVNLLYEATTVTAGLGFTAEIETLPSQSDSKEGNTLNFIKRYSKIFVYLLNSPRPVINGFDTYLRRSSTSMGSREANETGIIEMGNDGWDTDQSIIITQPLPVGMRILGLGGKLKENKL